MTANSSNLDQMINKAAAEAARMGSQVHERRKKIFDQMSSDIGESKDSDMPSIDLLETNEELVALVALPETTKDMIDLKVTEDSLAINAKPIPRNMAYLSRETSQKGFEREFKLPEEIKPEQVKASYENGILEIHLPKLVVVSAQRVSVD